jgi:hydroxymethylbilane synthase
MVQAAQTTAVTRIGTRGSPLALAQARMVQAQLAAARGLEVEHFPLTIIRTTGDVIQDRTLAEAGGKGLFTKEIEEALLRRTIDLAVHSAKDVPTVLPDGLVLTAVLPREDPRDVFIGRSAKFLHELAPGAVVGTASLRRQALVKRLRSDIEVVPIRGNVETRLRKLKEGAVDATLLALAGLKRLGLVEAASSIFPVEEFLPAVGQGVVAIETRADDRSTRALLETINHAETFTALVAERAFLAVLDGSCRTPIAGHATVAQGRLTFHGLIAKPDGRESFACVREGALSEAGALGHDAGLELKRQAGADFLKAVL